MQDDSHGRASLLSIDSSTKLNTLTFALKAAAEFVFAVLLPIKALSTTNIIGCISTVAMDVDGCWCAGLRRSQRRYLRSGAGWVGGWWVGWVSGSVSSAPLHSRLTPSLTSQTEAWNKLCGIANRSMWSLALHNKEISAHCEKCNRHFAGGTKIRFPGLPTLS